MTRTIAHSTDVVFVSFPDGERVLLAIDRMRARCLSVDAGHVYVLSERGLERLPIRLE